VTGNRRSARRQRCHQRRTQRVRSEDATENIDCIKGAKEPAGADAENEVARWLGSAPNDAATVASPRRYNGTRRENFSVLSFFRHAAPHACGVRTPPAGEQRRRAFISLTKVNPPSALQPPTQATKSGCRPGSAAMNAGWPLAYR
jgi:hypothetical protein